VNNEVRGFLSDQYRRLDPRPIIEAFVTGVMKLGALPFKGYVSDTKVCIQAIVPDVFEAIPGIISSSHRTVREGIQPSMPIPL
jgi:hypothetical protein